MEDKNIEYKYDISDKNNSFKREIVAFLNTKGGEIHLGVTNNGHIDKQQILKNRKQWEQTISNWLVDSFYPDVLDFITIDPNSFPFIIKISEGKSKPYCYKTKGNYDFNNIYIRFSSKTVKASVEQIKKMLLESVSTQCDNSLISTTDLTFNYVEQKFNNANIAFNKAALSLINKNGIYTRPALFLSDQNPLITKFAVYQSIDNKVFLDRQNLDGSMIKQIDTLLYLCNLKNETRTIITNQAKRIEIKNYPESSLREIILNCFCHRDYLSTEDIKVEIYSDRIEFYSPGSFPYNLTLQEAKNGWSYKRNFTICDILYKLKFIENYASGIRRVFDDYKSFEKQPEFFIEPSFVKVILYNRNFDTKNDDLKTNLTQTNLISDQTINDNLKPIITSKKIKKEQRIELILKLLAKQPNISYNELMSILNVTKSTIQRDISKLKDKNLIDNLGDTRTNKWIVKKQLN
ncbi:putative DNA binding domain-containing protein [Mycoplasma mycoides subsp. capri]|uniref:ATP-binding protein n=1 Tax=Mycoplasma mycoides TaxID=2102 RepID=UPI00224050EB|nr:ATP-binding protein [Mycoplasma mycoides]QVK01930.1 putative DNA binding domain-containing protein [Mycoplasma mycoides subsp. capri]